MKKHLLASLLLLSYASSFGAGYQLNMQGIRQLAMGGTGTAWAWDASTIYYNPAGLSRLKNIQVYASMGLIFPSTAYGNKDGESATTSPQTFTPFSFYFGGPIQQDSKFALGLGVYTSAGIGIKWDDMWPGRYLVQSMDLNAISFQPTISYRASEFISVGAGFIYSVGSFDMRQSLPIHGVYGPDSVLDDVGRAHLHGNANGVGFNIGVSIRPNDNLQIGITYRSQINMNLDGGTASFTVPNSLALQFPTTSFDSRLPLPQVASIGVGFRPSEHLTLQFDLNYTGWNSYDSLKINFAQHTQALQNMHAPRKYRNTLTPRIGANYKLSRVVSLMAGFFYDPTPVTGGNVSPELPDADRFNFTCGIALKPLPRFTIMAGFEGTTSVKRNATYDFGNFNGTYKTEAATPALALYYNF